MTMENEISVEIIIYNPETLYRCVDCETVWRGIETGHPTHLERAIENLPPDIAHDYRVMSEWVAGLIDRFPNQFHLRVVDAISVEGVAKSKRYHIDTYPAIIIDHHFVFSEGTLDEATIEMCRIVEQHQGEPSC